MSYSKNRKPSKRSSSDRELLGIGLIIVSAFLLLCITFPILFVSISQELRNIIMGLFGFASYGILISTLIVGIAFAQNRLAVLSKNQIALLISLGVMLILILHLVTVNSYISSPFSDYTSKVYDDKNTAGGLFFGVFDYGIASVITPLITYIVLAVIMIIMSYCLYFISKSHVPKARAVSNKYNNSFVKGNSVSLVKPIKDRSLYVANIEKPLQNYNTMSGSFQDFEDKRAMESDFKLPIDLSLEKKNRRFEGNELTRRQEPSDTKESIRGNAHKILFESKFDVYKDYSDRTGNEVKGVNDYVPPVANISPDVRVNSIKKPPKIVHKNPLLQEIILPEPRDFTKQYVPGKIINGEAVAEQASEKPKPAPVAVSTPYFNSNPIITGSPIVNGDALNTKADMSKKEQLADEDIFGVAKYPINNNPIIGSSNYNQEVANKTPKIKHLKKRKMIYLH